jgi:hypothetical protein
LKCNQHEKNACNKYNRENKPLCRKVTLYISHDFSPNEAFDASRSFLMQEGTYIIE